MADRELKTPAERLQRLRELAGYRSARAAALELGWPESSYRSHENGTRTIGADDAERYARQFGTGTAKWVMFGDPADKPSGEIVQLRARQAQGGFTPSIVPARELVGAGGFPIYAAAEGGSGHLIISTDIVETVKWPSVLEGVKGAYGIRVVGDSMAKAYRHGDMALVHPALPMRRDEVHIFYDHPPFGEAGDTEAMIKNLLSWNDRRYQLEQFNPHREWEVERADWPVAHQVVGKYSGR